MALVDTKDLISVTEANRLGISSLVKCAEEGRDRVVLRNNRPVAAVVGIDHLEEHQQLHEEIADVTLTAARMLVTGERRHTLDDVLDHFGYTRDELLSTDDD